MMWHFYEIPYIPDLELVKYQSLGEQGIDGILERHNRFLRQWQRNCCKTGAGLEKPNIVAAARYYEYGARAGVAAAQYELARIYLDKDMGDACFVGGANPYIGCERWLKKAAEQNYIYAEELLADKYYEGVYIVKDVKAAIYWYEKAANQGSVYAMYRAGYIYYSEPIDYNKAGQWFSLAAEKGDKDAEEVLRNNLRYNRFTKKWDAVR